MTDLILICADLTTLCTTRGCNLWKRAAQMRPAVLCTRHTETRWLPCLLLLLSATANVSRRYQSNKNSNNQSLWKGLLRCRLHGQAKDQKQRRYELQQDNVCLNHSSCLISKPRSLICNTGCLLGFSLESRPGKQPWSSTSRLHFQIMKNYLLD